MSKAAISLIQTGLRDAGFPPGMIDGIFGPKTNFAAQNWLLRGGSVSGTAVALIQSGLRDLGYQPGTVDGGFGPRTASAAQAWLQARGAAVTDIIAPETSSTIYQGSARYPVDEIIVHCSATNPDWYGNRTFPEQVAEIRRWHTTPEAQGGRGWRDIGYHWLVSRAGQVLAGRAETTIGAHVVDHNRGTIGICLIGGGGSASTDRFAQNFTTAQDTTLRQLIQGIGMRTRITRITGHNVYANKACPGFNVSNWLKEAA